MNGWHPRSAGRHSAQVQAGGGKRWAKLGALRAVAQGFAVRLPVFGMTALAVLISLTASADPAASATRKPDRPCVAGQPSITVTVNGFKTDNGMVRAQLYGPVPGDFLDKGKWVMRIEERRTKGGSMEFCFPVANPGRYAVAVRHDANNNGKSDWNDGGGFTNNPRLSLTNLKPAFAAAAIQVGSRPVDASVVMQYRQGLVIKPIR